MLVCAADYTSAQLLSLSSLPHSMLEGCNYEVGGQKRVRKREIEREKEGSKKDCLSTSSVAETLFAVRHGDVGSTLCSRRKVLRLLFSYLLQRQGNAPVDGECLWNCKEQYSRLFFFPVCFSVAFKYELDGNGTRTVN